MRFWTLSLAFGLAILPTAIAADSPVADFTLSDYHGKPYSLADFKDRQLIVVTFVGAECPLAKLYGPRLEELAKEFAPKGVGFIGVDPNSQDGVTQIAAYARLQGITFPILKDLNNLAADRFGARREGIFRQAAVIKGRNRDTAWYSVIDPEWPALREAFVKWLEPSNFDANGQQFVSFKTLRSSVSSFS